jgi:serine/threonine-protein kinase/endoribonuclease IRE1
VKRLLGHYYEKAQKEIALLITSDEHPNVVRYYAMEETPDFIYVALERCSLSLNDLILSQSAQSPFQNDKRDSINLTDEKQLKLASGKELKLWDKEGYPSLQLLQLMRYDCSKQYLRDNDSPIFFMIDLENMEFLEVCCRRVRIKD